MNRQFTKFIILILVLSFYSCAYFNTFYNAKNYYKNARKAADKNTNKKLSAEEIKNYESTIDKSKIVVRKYPNSRYVDDSLLLMSKSYYYLGDYENAKINLEELLRRYPESKFKDETLLWTGRVAWKLGQIITVEEGIKEVLSGTQDKKILSDGFGMLAEIYRDLGDIDNELIYLKEVLDYSKNNQQKAETTYRMGMIEMENSEYQNASNLFQKVEFYLPTPELLEKAKMENTRALKKMGITVEALDILQAMLDSERFKKIRGEIQVEMAEIALQLGDIDGAIENFGFIGITYPKNAVAAQAWTRLGELHAFPNNGSTEYINYPFANEYYSRAVKSPRKGSSRIIAIRNNKILSGYLISLDTIQKNNIELIWNSGDKKLAETRLYDYSLVKKEMLEGILPGKSENKKKKQQNSSSDENDSGVNDDELGFLGNEDYSGQQNSDSDSSINITKSDSLPDLAAAEKDSLILSPEEIKEKELESERKILIDANKFGIRGSDVILREIILNEYLVAEYYYLDLMQPDSAQKLFKKILSHYPQSDFASRSALSLGILFEDEFDDHNAADSMYRIVLNKYPESPSTIEAARRTDIKTSTDKKNTNPAAALYEQAFNEAMIKKDRARAISLIQQIEINYPLSDYAARSAFLRATVIDEENKDPERLLKEYNVVIANYSETKYAAEARIKVKRLQRMIAPKTTNPEEEEEQKNQKGNNRGKKAKK